MDYFDLVGDHAVSATESSPNNLSASESDVVEGPTVSMSTAFHAYSDLDVLPPDILIASSDDVHFSVHRHVLLRMSCNRFDSLLPADTADHPTKCLCPVILPEDSATVNVILHTVYDMTCRAYNPTFATIVSAIQSLSKYGVSLHKCLARGAPLCDLFLSQAPLRPVEAFALAAENHLEDLAVATSSYLLSVKIVDISDEIADRIGAIHLKRFVTLQSKRARRLRDLLAPPPYPHAPLRGCEYADRQALLRAWVLATACIDQMDRPDISGTAIQTVLGSLAPRLSCDACKKSLMKRVQDIVVNWALTERTI